MHELIQKIGEDYVTKLLKERSFTILARNAIRSPFEFDIICSNNNATYLIEVRTTCDTKRNLIEMFPLKKLATLFKGAALYYPLAILVCANVNLSASTNRVSFYYAAELL